MPGGGRLSSPFHSVRRAQLGGAEGMWKCSFSLSALPRLGSPSSGSACQGLWSSVWKKLQKFKTGVVTQNPPKILGQSLELERSLKGVLWCFHFVLCSSYSNPREVKLVMELIKTIKEKRSDLGLRRIGIITPYSAQKKRIQEQLDSVFKNNR